MTTAELYAKVREIINQVIEAPIEKITNEAHLIDDLGMDSLDAIELILRVEEAFGCEITDDEAEDIKTVGGLLRLIERKVAVTG